MVKLQINHKDVELLVLVSSLTSYSKDYLQENRLLKTMLALEEEAGIQLFKYGKETQFLRQLILEGQWEDAENFLKPAQGRTGFDYDNLLFLIRK